MLPNSWRLENGVMTAFLAVIAGGIAVAISVVGFSVNLAFAKREIQLVADASALIVSETSRGLIAGFSCENAEQFTKSFDIDLDSCRIVSSDASLRLAKWFGPIRLQATASAEAN